MNTVNKTALANLRLNKGRNILAGCAVGLTTLLVFLILTIGYGLVRLQTETVNLYYPTYHAMYRPLDEETVKKLEAYQGFETHGLRLDLGQVMWEDGLIVMSALDQEAIRLNKLELTRGEFPKEENQVVVSPDMLQELGIQGDIGDEITLEYQPYEAQGLGYAREDSFVISGFFEASEENREAGVYSVLTSMEYARNQIPLKDREYYVLVRLAGAEHMYTDQIEAMILQIAQGFGLTEDNVVENTDYLSANYVDPALTQGMVMVVLVVVLAGILTIYSIYYVSMIPKVQEYGKLKALGASRKQIRQMVFREGLLVTGMSLPLGLLISSFLAPWISRTMFSYGRIGEAANLIRLGLELLESGRVTVLNGWIYLITIAVVLATVFLSLLRPMKIAAKISPIEAMGYQGEVTGRMKQRKGYESLSLIRLTKANLSRNRKRTIITICTLSATGVLFMTVATLLSCANPREIAKQEIESDYSISVESWSGDKMHPDRDWDMLQQNNPLNREFLEQIRSIQGVKELKVKTFLEVDMPDFSDGDQAWNAGITGLDASYAQMLESMEYQGHVTYEELLQGDKIVMGDIMLHWLPDLKVGDTLRMECHVGQERVMKEFEIAAIAQYYSGFSENGFLLPQQVVEEINPNNLNSQVEITLEKEKNAKACQELDALTETSEYLESHSFEKTLEMWEGTMELLSLGCYVFLFILGGVGMMNLVNTMLNSIYTRKRELGMIQAIGMSEVQLVRMLQAEGLFYTLGTLLLSIGLGSLAGYGVFLNAKADRMFNITQYHYPLIPALVLAAVVAVGQLLLTYGVSANFRKLSLIDRIRYSE